ncbi:MAG: ribosome maturation factor RimM [Lachnospiraceae bacterium]
MDNKKNSTLRVGQIVTTHGIRGEVKVFPTTDDVSRFKKLKKCILDGRRGYVDLEVESCKFFKNMVILKFKGYDDINQVLDFVKRDLLVTRDNAVKLAKGEYFICDLVGLKVVTDEGRDFGILKDIMQTGANDVYVIETLDGREVLFPSIPECILNRDLEAGVITVHIMKGLLEANE